MVTSSMQGGPVDELLDVAVERPALDELETLLTPVSSPVAAGGTKWAPRSWRPGLAGNVAPQSTMQEEWVGDRQRGQPEASMLRSSSDASALVAGRASPTRRQGL